MKKNCPPSIQYMLIIGFDYKKKPTKKKKKKTTSFSIKAATPGNVRMNAKIKQSREGFIHIGKPTRNNKLIV